MVDRVGTAAKKPIESDLTVPLTQASLDQPTQTVVMHRTEPTAQQNLALQLAEKLGSLVENNERVFDHKQGTYGGYFRGEPVVLLLHSPMILRICLFPGAHSQSFLSTFYLQTKRMATEKMKAICAVVATASSSLRQLTEVLTSCRPYDQTIYLFVPKLTPVIKGLLRMYIVACCHTAILDSLANYVSEFPPHDRCKVQMQDELDTPSLQRAATL